MGYVRLFLLQSAHILLGSNFTSDLSVAWFFAARSAAGFGGRRDIPWVFFTSDPKVLVRSRRRLNGVRASGSLFWCEGGV